MKVLSVILSQLVMVAVLLGAPAPAGDASTLVEPPPMGSIIGWE